jgi:hypothetical protein
MDSLPEWTPGPGEYILPTDFNKKTEEKRVKGESDEEPETVEIVPRWD